MQHVCMVPSVGLSESEVENLPIAKLASALALKILERPIIRDYLEYTYQAPEYLLAQVPNEVDWWDTVDKSSYAKVLAQRHKNPTYDQWMAIRNLKMPDISTFDGPPMLLGFGAALIRLPAKPPKRREFYEIKPDNDAGLSDAQAKLKNVEASYSKTPIAGLYRRGLVYPPFGIRRRIVLKSRFVETFRYLTNLYLRPLGISVLRISIELRQAEPGAVLYKICVDLEGAEQASASVRRIVASFAIRILSEINTIANTPEVRAATKAMAIALEPDQPPIEPPGKVQWIYARRDFRTTPMLQLRQINQVADEVEPLFEGIRNAMYSRLIGSPGERYFICADKAWYETNVQIPGMLRNRNVARMVGTGSLIRSVHARSLLGVAPTMILTAKDFALSIPVVGDALRWLSEHIELVVIVIAATVIVTALIVFTAGAAAVPLAAGAAVEVGTASAASGAVVMTESVMAGAVGTETAALSAPVLAAEGETIAVTTMRAVTQRLITTPLTQVELASTAGEQIADNILIRALTSPQVQSALAAGVRSAIPLTKAVGALAAMTVIGLCPSRAYAYGGPANGPVQAASLNVEQSVDLGTGRLMVLKVPQILPYSCPKRPELYAPFPADQFAGQTEFSPNGPKKQLGDLYMLGEFEVI